MAKSANSKTLLYLLVIPSVMLALSFVAVPFYSWFCKVTGFGGTTQVADVDTEVTATDKDIVIRFDATTAPDLPWRFAPKENKVTLKIGESALAFYEAENLSDDIITGTASFNVSPNEAGGYFTKIECFCFTEQTLQPGEKVDMPVTFYVDPAILENSDTKNIAGITLSYTFHLTKRENGVEDGSNEDVTRSRRGAVADAIDGASGGDAN